MDQNVDIACQLETTRQLATFFKVKQLSVQSATMVALIGRWQCSWQQCGCPQAEVKWHGGWLWRARQGEATLHTARCGASQGSFSAFNEGEGNLPDLFVYLGKKSQQGGQIWHVLREGTSDARPLAIPRDSPQPFSIFLRLQVSEMVWRLTLIRGGVYTKGDRNRVYLYMRVSQSLWFQQRMNNTKWLTYFVQYNICSIYW